MLILCAILQSMAISKVWIGLTIAALLETFWTRFQLILPVHSLAMWQVSGIKIERTRACNYFSVWTRKLTKKWFFGKTLRSKISGRLDHSKMHIQLPSLFNKRWQCSGYKGSPHFKKVQFFWTLFKRPLTPPLLFEHLSYFAGGVF